MSCSISDCYLDAHTRGWCRAHYKRHLEGKEMQSPVRRRRRRGETRICSVASCGGTYLAKGLCNKHYLVKHPRTSTTSWGKWLTTSQGYVSRYRVENGKRLAQSQHREVMKAKLGRDLLPQENVHHINGVRDDNRPENLELWSTSQPPGQRVEDKALWAISFLEIYGYTVLQPKGLESTM